MSSPAEKKGTGPLKTATERAINRSIVYWDKAGRQPGERVGGTNRLTDWMYGTNPTTPLEPGSMPAREYGCPFRPWSFLCTERGKNPLDTGSRSGTGKKNKNKKNKAREKLPWLIIVRLHVIVLTHKLLEYRRRLCREQRGLHPRRRVVHLRALGRLGHETLGLRGCGCTAERSAGQCG